MKRRSSLPHGSYVIALALPVMVLVVVLSAVSPTLAAPADDRVFAASAGVAAPMGTASWNLSWDHVTEFLRQSLGSKRRMIQISTIGVCIGLFIMFRSKH